MRAWPSRTFHHRSRYIDPNYPVLTSAVHKWAGGGNSAMDPMWHIVGSDRLDYFVGADLNVHVQNDLPIVVGQP